MVFIRLARQIFGVNIVNIIVIRKLLSTILGVLSIKELFFLQIKLFIRRKTLLSPILASRILWNSQRGKNFLISDHSSGARQV